jgi:tetratricopeptide (TPR) repeat protein
MALSFINKSKGEGIRTLSLIEKLIEKNKITKAERLCQRILADYNEEPRLLICMGKIAIKKGDIDSAIQLLFKALAQAPRDQKLQFELAKILYSVRFNYPEAAKASLAILSQINDNKILDSAKLLLAKIFRESNYYEEAVLNLKSLLNINPDNDKAHTEWAKLLIKEGKNLEAASKLEKSLFINQSNAEAYFLLSKICSFKDLDHHHVQNMKKNLDFTKANHLEKSFLNLSLAKVYMDQEDHSKALDYFKEAASHKHKDINYDFNKDKQLLNLIQSVFNQRLFELKKTDTTRQDNSDLRSFKPVFLISFPGINHDKVINQILENDALEYLGENSFLSQMLAGSRYSDAFSNLVQNFTELSEENLDVFREHYYDSTEKIIKGKIPLDTSKINFLFVGLIKLLFPCAELIFIKVPKEQALFETYSTLYEEDSMNFSYNLKDLNEYYQAFEQMMEYWTELFSKDIKTINITNNEIPEKMLTLFNQHLDSVLEIENKITIESN